MSSVKCPSCGLANFASSSSCKRCKAVFAVSSQGALVASSPVTEEIAPVLREGTPNSNSCRNCCGSEIKSYEMIYAAGTSTGSVATGEYNFQTGSSFTSGQIVQQSQLASRVQPPTRPTEDGSSPIVLTAVVGVFCLIAGAIICAGGHTVIGSLVILGPPSYVFVKMLKSSKKRYEREVESYQSAVRDWRCWWMCLSCGFAWKR